MKRRNFLSYCATVAAAAYGQRPIFGADHNVQLPSADTVHVGGSKRIDIGGGHWVWTKKVGSGDIKVLLLHGGPGADHRYFEGFEDFLPLNGIEFYYYDQLDSTNSDKPNDPALWTIERYTDEVEAVRRGLGLDQFYLLGHSWGGLLAIEYALKYQQHLKGLVISNMAASTDSFMRHVSKIRAQFSADIRGELEFYENANKTDDPAYQALLFKKLYKVFICRLSPWPDPVLRSLGGWNQHVYKALQGRSEFEATGRMKGWDRWADLPRIKIRTLTMGARYDEMDPNDMRRMATLLPHGEAWISGTGSHFAMYDDQQNYFKALLTFLKATQFRTNGCVTGQKPTKYRIEPNPMPASPVAMQPPANINSKLLCFRSGKDHAIAQRMEEVSVADPPLLHQLVVNDGNGSGGAAVDPSQLAPEM